MRLLILFFINIFLFASDINEVNKHKIDLLKNDIDELNKLRYEIFILKKDNFSQPLLPHVESIKLEKNSTKYNANAQIYDNANSKSGFFIGLGLGGTDLFNISKDTTSVSNSLLLSLRGGYQSFFNQYFGTRIYGSIFGNTLNNLYDYQIRSGESLPVSIGGKPVSSLYLLGNLSADLLLEFPLDYAFSTYIGGFIGVNIGAMYYKNYKVLSRGVLYPADYLWKHLFQIEYSINIGINLTINNSNRIETHISAPFAYLQLPGLSLTANNESVLFNRSYIFMISYNYIF